MINGKKVIAIILARQGSKRLVNKNILSFAGKPLIAWTIIEAKKSKHIDDIIVSSDSDEILKISKKYGSKIIKRPKNLAKDTSNSYEAIVHIFENIHESYGHVILLQPTSPLRTAEHISEAFELLIKKNADSIVSVCKMDHSPLWSNILPEDDSMINFIAEDVIDKRSQDLEEYYRINGAIYICKIEKYLDNGGFFLKENIYAYKMPKNHSIDIDDKFDFKLAESIFEK